MIKNQSVKIAFLAFAAVFLLVAESNAQWGRPRPGYYGRGYGSIYRPRVSVGIGAYGGYAMRPRVGVSVGIGFPGVGIYLSTLPRGYSRYYYGGDPYYYYNDRYYRESDRGGYEAVAPPLGATVRRLPPGTRERIIDGDTYYEFDGIFFVEDRDENGKRVYIVVGTDGNLDTDAARSRSYEDRSPAYPDRNLRNNRADNREMNSDKSEAPKKDAPQVRESGNAKNYQIRPQIGDRFEILPKDTRTITVNGEKQFESPSGTYYKEVIENGKTVYEVVKVSTD